MFLQYFIIAMSVLVGAYLLTSVVSFILVFCKLEKKLYTFLERIENSLISFHPLCAAAALMLFVNAIIMYTINYLTPKSGPNKI